jgi:hypothetical protein
MHSDAAEILRKRYKYRRLILSGKLKLPHTAAAKLLGPDCAYHLYGLEESVPGKPKKSKRRRKS